MKGDPRLRPAAFRPSNQLPEKLPDGAHRVISELTSAKMRSMMQGIVTEGTGKAAALNGYSSAGKTGTAQKIDPATRTYSHTKLVASFAGFAPVNNPAISIAVVMDTPQGTEAQRYGGAASAPVFAEVAQQVLEYLGVPHDQPVKSKQEMLAETKKGALEEGPQDEVGDLSAMYAAVNELPADDPLRSAQQLASAEPAEAQASTVSRMAGRMDGVLRMLPAKVLEAFRANGGTTSTMPDAREGLVANIEAPKVDPEVQVRGNGVVVDASRRVAVPDFTHADLRSVVEKAGGIGLRVQPVGSGLAREQAPAAGTMVAVGTEVVVRFLR
jgi:cell division protein FtsI (penicillin-binding protein 3)